MNVKDFIIRKVEKRHVKDFIINHHYSRTTSTAQFWFALLDKDDLFNRLIGAASFGHPTGRRQREFYYPENPDKILELRRLCLVDEAPKNSESRFVSLCIKYLKSHTDYEAILSLADPAFGHSGTIYKASNFKYLGVTEVPGNAVYEIDSEIVHPRTLYNRHGTSSREDISRIYGNRVKILDRIPKIAYIYYIKRQK